MRQPVPLRLAHMRRRSAPVAAPQIPADAATAIARVNDLARAARAGWLSLLFVLAFIAITLAGVEDIDFFIPERQTPLPLVGVSIPTTIFFILGPPLIAALYGNLHFHLLKLWGALSPSRLPPQVAGVPVSDHIVASFIVDLGLHFRRDGALRRRDLRLLTSVLTFVLVFVLAPGILTWMWLRSMYSLQEALTVIACGLPLAFTLHVMCSSLSTVWSRCGYFRGCAPYSWRRPWRWLWRPMRRALYAALLPHGTAAGGMTRRNRRRTGRRQVWMVLVLSLVGWFRTEGTLDWYATRWLGLSSPTEMALPADFDWVTWAIESPRTQMMRLVPTGTGGAIAVIDDRAEPPLRAAIMGLWNTQAVPFWRRTFAPGFLASPRLSDEAFLELTPGWEDWRNARISFAERWCTARNLPRETCPSLPNSNAGLQTMAALSQAHRDYCAMHMSSKAHSETESCRAYFLNLIRRMEEDWQRHRTLEISSLPRRDFIGRDFRGADLSGANLVGVDLTMARLTDANLSGSVLEAVSMSQAQMQRADLTASQMQGTNLRGAQMQGADLVRAETQGGDLTGAQMQGANLAEAQMHGAILRDAQMQGAGLVGAEMQGANLWGAQMHGAILRNAQMQGAGLVGAEMSENTDLTAATLRGAAVRSVDDTTVAQLAPFWQEIFADGTVARSDPDRPAHWSDETLGAGLLFFVPSSAFAEAWRDWAATLDPPVTIAPDFNR